MATVVPVGGSAPRGPGAALAAERDGTVTGSVPGGCVEGAVHDLCVEAPAGGMSRTGRLGHGDEDASAVGHDADAGPPRRAACHGGGASGGRPGSVR